MLVIIRPRDDPRNRSGLGWRLGEDGDGIAPFQQSLRFVSNQLALYTFQKEAEAAVKMMMVFSIQPEVSNISLESWE